MATCKCANEQVQASSEFLGKRNACALHLRELKKNSHRSRRRMHVHKCQKTTTICQMSEFGAEMIACPWNQQVHLQFAESLMQKSSKLELFYQIVKTNEFLKYARRSRASKALPLDDLSINVWSLLCWILGLSLKMWRSLLIQRLSLDL